VGRAVGEAEEIGETMASQAPLRALLVLGMPRRVSRLCRVVEVMGWSGRRPGKR
jgi:hypothetical protein